MLNTRRVEPGTDSNGRQWGDAVCYGTYGGCGYRFFLVVRTDFNTIPKSERIRGFWMAEPRRADQRYRWANHSFSVFVTCPCCGSVNNVSDHEIDAEGRFGLSDCVVCRRCSVHFFPQLLGWPEFRKEA